MSHPSRPRTPAILEPLRKICLDLPDTVEKEAWGAPTFRVKGKMFLMYAEYHHGDAHIAIWCKADPEAQRMVVGSNPAKFFVPPYVGPGGWIGMRLDVDLDWAEVADVVRTSYHSAIPKKLPKPARKAPARKKAAPAKKARK